MSKRFSEQFKQSAVELVTPEHCIAEVAHSLGVGHSRGLHGNRGERWHDHEKTQKSP
jgi:transposase-like protein